MKIGGLLLCFAGMALLCAMDAVAKGLGAHLNAFQIGFVRYGGAAVWLVLYVALARQSWPKLGNWRRHVLRGLLMVVTACLFFYGVTHLPLAIATALAMSAPILHVLLFGIVFFKERPSPVLAIAIVLGIIGSAVMVIGGDASGATDITGWIAGLLAPITDAAAIVLLKHHADDDSAVVLCCTSAAVAALVLVPLALPGFPAPVDQMWWQLPLIGFFGACGFVLLTDGAADNAGLELRHRRLCQPARLRPSASCSSP